MGFLIKLTTFFEMVMALFEIKIKTKSSSISWLLNFWLLFDRGFCFFGLTSRSSNTFVDFSNIKINIFHELFIHHDDDFSPKINLTFVFRTPFSKTKIFSLSLFHFRRALFYQKSRVFTPLKKINLFIEIKPPSTPT